MDSYPFLRINTRSATHLLTIMSSHPVAYFFTIAAIQPPLYGAEIVTTLPGCMVFFIRR